MFSTYWVDVLVENEVVINVYLPLQMSEVATEFLTRSLARLQIIVGDFNGRYPS